MRALDWAVRRQMIAEVGRQRFPCQSVGVCLPGDILPEEEGLRGVGLGDGTAAAWVEQASVAVGLADAAGGSRVTRGGGCTERQCRVP